MDRFFSLTLSVYIYIYKKKQKNSRCQQIVITKQTMSSEDPKKGIYFHCISLRELLDECDKIVKTSRKFFRKARHI